MNVTYGGQGNSILVNEDYLVERAEVFYDNSADKVQFPRENVDE